ncbi:Nuclear pore complex protein, partial [Globisporangium splendens]
MGEPQTTDEAQRTQRLLKGLADAKNRVDQVAREDAQYPDLYDQLANQSEPQNYFFEPYATQWCPQIVKKGNVIPLPGVIATSLEDTKSITLSGLLHAIDYAWTSVDTRLFLWNYKTRGKFAVFEFDQAVVAVGICVKPAPGVFTDKVQHVLVVATTVEVLLVAVLYENNDPQGGAVKLQRTKLSVSTDNCVVRRIVTTRNGRIFFGGSDGSVYEFLYGPDAESSSAIPFFNKPCKKIAHTSTYAAYLPSFLMGLTSSPGKILEFANDEERQILYSLHENGHITLFDQGVSGEDTKVVCSLNLLEAGAKYARENRRTRVSCPDERLFQNANMQIVSLAVIPREESAFVNLVAVASNAIRFYITAYSRRTYTVGNAIPRTKRPSRLEIVYIRLPPPAISLADAPPYHSKEGMQPGYAPGKSPSSVHVSFHRKGVFLAVDGRKDQQDQLVGIAHDPITTSIPTQTTSRKPTIRESVSLDSCIGKVVEIKELDLNEQTTSTDASAGAARNGSKRSFDEMSNGSNDAVSIVGEMALQYSQPSRHFLCLTNAGIQVFKKIRPIDQLHRILLLSRGSELKASLAPFIRCFGEIQVCCMLIALACGVQSDPLTSETTAASLVGRRTGIKSDDYIYTAAMQGIFECGQGNAAGVDNAGQMESTSTSTRIVLTTEFGFSYQHDGLVMFVTRLLRPLWCLKSIGKRVVARVPGSSSKSSDQAGATVTYETVHSVEKLDEIREILFQLRQLMESAGPYAVSISSGSVLENNAGVDGLGEGDAFSRVSELASRYQKNRTEEQLQREMRFKAEQRSLYYVYQLVLRSIEGISLLRIALDYKVSLEEPLARLSFSDFVSTAEGTTAAKVMIKSLMRGRNENNQYLIKQLREQCPSFFSVADLWHYQGYKSLAMAKLSAPSARKAYLKESLSQFLNSCHMWDTEDCIEVLQGICDDYALLNFYEGAVKLSLACAKNFHDAAASDLSGAKLTWKRNCFGCILLTLQRVLNSDKAQKSGQSPQSIDDMVSLDEETRSKYVEEILHFALASEDGEFHELLYTWLFENGHSQLLTSIRSPFIEDFLKEKDQDLLIKLYMDQQKYLVAAKVWWSRAHEDNSDEDNGVALESNPDIVKRQYYVSKALGCLKSLEEVGEAADAAREVRDVLDVLQLQVRVLKALEQSTIELEASMNPDEDELRERKDDLKMLTFKIFDASTLYNQFAAKYDMWSECLHIIHSCNSEEADVVASLWRKIIFSIVPPSSSNPEFNAWRADQCETAGLSAQFSGMTSFESGLWIGQLQGKVLRLGKTLYYSGDDSHGGSTASALGGFVFPVGFLAKQLEQVSSWYLRLTQRPSYAAGITSSSSSSIDATTFNWVLKMFLDVGVPYRVLLSYYEQIYREQGSLTWTLHLLQSMFAMITLWKKHAISPRAGKNQLADFAACCPHLVDLCDDFITDLKAIPLDEHIDASTLLEQYRRLKSDLLAFRNLM